MDDSRQEGVELPSELEFGDETGDRRENDPRAPGYTPEDDRVFRSHFQRANRLADRGFEQTRPTYALGEEGRRDLAREGFERGRALGFIADAPPSGTTPTHDRPSFADPVPGNVEPTAPESPEQVLLWEHQGADAATLDADRDMPSDKQRPLLFGAEPGPTADQGGFGWKSPRDAKRRTRGPG